MADGAASASPETTALVDDPISLIDDTIVRRLVRVAVHVRGYAPYYGATVAFGLMLLFVPALGGGGDDSPTGFAGAASGSTGVATQAPTTSAAPYASGDLEYASTADDFFDDSFTTEDDYDYAGTYTFDDVDYGSDSDSSSGGGSSSESVEKDRPCTIAAAPGAPQVSPDREVNNAQSTLEAAAGREAPAEAAPSVKTAAEATGQCAGGTNDATSASDVVPVDSTVVPTRVDTDAVFRLVGDLSVI